MAVRKTKMGRPKAKAPVDVILTIRVTTAERELFDRAVGMIPFSRWARMTLVEAAERKIKKGRTH